MGALLGKYVEHHTFVETKVLAPLRDCATFADYSQLDLPDGLRLQTFHQKNKSPGASAPLSVVATLCLCPQAFQPNGWRRSSLPRMSTLCEKVWQANRREGQSGSSVVVRQTAELRIE